MDFIFVLKAFMAVVPVLGLLVVFDRLDVFDLISTRVIAILVAAGAGVAFITLQINTTLTSSSPQIRTPIASG